MNHLDIPYDRRPLLPTSLFFVFGIIVLNIVADSLLSFDLISAAIAALVSAVAIIVLAVSPLITSHSLGPEGLTLRQGWYFRAQVPLSAIKSVSEMEKGPLRTGVFFDIRGSSLYVTTRRTNLLVATLKEKQRFGLALGKRADRLVFDTVDKRRLFNALSEVGGITLSSPGLAS